MDFSCYSRLNRNDKLCNWHKYKKTKEKLIKDNIEQSLKEASSALLEMVRNSCWNKISNNTSYIISEIINDERNFFDKRIKRKKANEKKNPKSLVQITAELKDIYENLYDINLYVYKSKKESTIIEIQYYPKSSLESDFYETVKSNEPMLHCKIGLPHYQKNNNEKFDVNWELGGIRHVWNNLLGKMRYRIWKWKHEHRQRLYKENK